MPTLAIVLYSLIAVALICVEKYRLLGIALLIAIALFSILESYSNIANDFFNPFIFFLFYLLVMTVIGLFYASVNWIVDEIKKVKIELDLQKQARTPRHVRCLNPSLQLIGEEGDTSSKIAPEFADMIEKNRQRKIQVRKIKFLIFGLVSSIVLCILAKNTF
jgi:hypothetical protein